MVGSIVGILDAFVVVGLVVVDVVEVVVITFEVGVVGVVVLDLVKVLVIVGVIVVLSI